MIRQRSTCKMCALAGKRRVWSEPPAPGGKLLVLGEAPGQDEEAQGKPFVGASGRLLNWAFGQTGIYRPATWITNVISCRPTDNDISTIEGRDAIEACRPGLLDELAQAQAAGVTTVLALGATAARALGVQGKLEEVRGSVYQWHNPRNAPGSKGLYVIPTYHPAAIMRQHWKRSGGGTADGGVLWLADFRKAKSIAQDGFKTLQERFVLEPTVQQVTAFVEKCLRENALVAIDTETTGLSLDYAKIVVIGLASGPEDALSVPLLTTDGAQYWSPEDWPVVREALMRLFTTCSQMYQNCFFDVPMLRKAGFPIPSKLIQHDTLVLHHTLSPEAKHDLGTIVSLYGKTPYWKGEFKNRTVSILKMDQHEMRRYNLRDCVVLHQVLPVLLDEMRQLGVLDVYHDEAQPLIGCILEMQANGIGFVPGRVVAFKADLEKRIATLSAKLYEDLSLPPAFNLDSDDHLRWLLYGTEPTAFRHLVELPKKRSGTKIHAELTALDEVRRLGGPRYRLPSWSPPTTETGKPAVDKDGLLAFRIQLNNRLHTIKSPEELALIPVILDWLKTHAEYTRLQKLLSTYTKYRPDADGRIRPRWILHGTVSGRLACLSGDTILSTTRGSFRLDEYQCKDGDRILTHTGSIKRIVKKFYQGIRPCFKLTFDKHTSIISTADHKFLTPTGWKEVQELKIGSEVFGVNLEEAHIGSGDHPECSSSLSGRSGETDGKSDWGAPWNLSCFSDENHSGLSRSGSSSSREGLEVLPIKVGGEQPDVAKVRKTTSQLEGGLLRQQRSSDKEGRSEKILCSQDSICRSTRNTSFRTISEVVDSSHRRESDEQCNLESLSMYKEWAWKTAPSVEKLTSITPVGDVQVFDIEVEDDHSFVVNGLISHNCREPNLTNVPKPKDDPDDPASKVRSFFVPRPGWSFVSCDYVNLEAQLLAYETLDPGLCSVFEQGINLHDLNTRSMFRIDESSNRWKAARAAAKIFFFGGIAYGGGDQAIYQQVYNKAPELELTFADFKRAKDNWMADHPAYVAWKNALSTEVTTTRTVRTEFGRVRQFLSNDKDIIKEALDYRIQSPGASLVNRAMARFCAARDAAGLKARLCLQIHDQIVVECPDDEVPAVRDLLVRELERPFQFRGKIRHIPVDCTVGSSFAEL